MSELLDHSSAIVDAWTAPGGPAPDALDGPTNRITNELSEVGDGIAVVESFSHVVAFRTDDGLVLFDASAQFTAEGVVQSLRGWADDPVHTLVYTHGHVDHVGGSGMEEIDRTFEQSSGAVWFVMDVGDQADPQPGKSGSDAR